MPSVREHLASGALSGFTSTIFLQPFDLLKTRQQQLNANVHTGVLNTAREVVAHNGVQGLWRGTAASLTRNIPGIALYMTSLTQLRTTMTVLPMFRSSQSPSSSTVSALPTLSPTGNLLAGAAARVAVGFVLNPISVLKARYEVRTHLFCYWRILRKFER
jgi:solute carrier family 25, member 38